MELKRTPYYATGTFCSIHLAQPCLSHVMAGGISQIGSSPWLHQLDCSGLQRRLDLRMDRHQTAEHISCSRIWMMNIRGVDLDKACHEALAAPTRHCPGYAMRRFRLGRSRPPRCHLGKWHPLQGSPRFRKTKVGDHVSCRTPIAKVASVRQGTRSDPNSATPRRASFLNITSPAPGDDY